MSRERETRRRSASSEGVRVEKECEQRKGMRKERESRARESREGVRVEKECE